MSNRRFRSDRNPSLFLSTSLGLKALYWSVRRELWEHRWIYIAPSVLSALLFGTFILNLLTHAEVQESRTQVQVLNHFIFSEFYFSQGLLAQFSMLLALIYSVGAFYGERRQGNLAFWKSLPVSDLVTAVAKTCIPFLILPLITIALSLVLHELMYLTVAVLSVSSTATAAARLSQTLIIHTSSALSYRLFVSQITYCVPLYGWLLLVSVCVKRAPLLWATLPPVVMLVLEKGILHTTVLADYLKDCFYVVAFTLPPELGGRIAAPILPLTIGPWRVGKFADLLAGLTVLVLLIEVVAACRRRQSDR